MRAAQSQAGSVTAARQQGKREAGGRRHCSGGGKDPIAGAAAGATATDDPGGAFLSCGPFWHEQPAIPAAGAGAGVCRDARESGMERRRRSGGERVVEDGREE